MANRDSDIEFLSDLLNCDVNQLRTIDDASVQNEIARLTESVADDKQPFKCNNCETRFGSVKTLNRHLKKNTCSNGKRFICQNCGKTYEKQAFLTRHTELGKCVRPRLPTDVNASSTTCTKCGRKFLRRSNLSRHLKRNVCSSVKQDSVFNCGRCGKSFSSVGALKSHSKTHDKSDNAEASGFSGGGSGGGDDGGGDDGGGSHDDDADAADDDDDGDDGEQSRRTLFQGALVRYTLKAQRAEQQDLMYFFSNRRRQLRKNLLRELRRFRHLKWYVVLKIDMVRLNSDGDIVDQGSPNFRSFTKQVLDPSAIDSQIDDAFFKMLNSLDMFRAEGSGWMIQKVIHMEQSIAKYSPLSGSCYNYQIPGPLLRKRCLLNVTGPPDLDGHCFKYAMLAGLYTGEDTTGEIPWSDLHEFRNVLTFDGVASSGRYMPITSIAEFEKNNGLSVNVYGYEEEEVFPVYVTNQFNRQRHVNLLLLCPRSDSENDDDGHDHEIDNVGGSGDVENFQTITEHRRAHYCVIKNMSGLVAQQARQWGRRSFICMRCLTIKPSADSLSEHERLCSQEEEEPIRCFMPGQEDKWLKFRNLGKRMKVSFVIVACFSCYTVPLLSNDEATHGYEVRERRLDPCAYSYMRISVDNSHPKEPVYYRGTSPTDTMDHFLSAMASEEEDVFSIMSQTAPMVWCDEGLANVEASNDICIWCRDPFLPGDKVCLDHSHTSGEY